MEKKEIKSVKKHTLKDIRADKSDGKTYSHLLLKAGVTDNAHLFVGKCYTKKILKYSVELMK